MKAAACCGPRRNVFLRRKRGGGRGLWGLAARLGETLSGGVPGFLARFALSLGEHPPTLRLRRAQQDRNMLGETVMRRFETLAAAMERAPDSGLRQ